MMISRFQTATLFLLFTLTSSAVLAQYNDIYKQGAWTERDKWQQVPKILEALDLQENSFIADIGSHQGYMTVKMAENIGELGKVYAVDVDQWKLDKLKRILKERGLEDRVEVIKGEYDNPKLPENQLDAVLIMDAYHEMDDYKEILRHIKNSLKSDGRLVLIEPVSDNREKWSRSRQEEKHEIAIRYACNDLKKAGFTITKEIYPFIDREDIKGDKLWMIVAKPVKEI